MPEETRETFSHGSRRVLSWSVRLPEWRRGNSMNGVNEWSWVGLAIAHVSLKSVFAIFVEVTTLIFAIATAIAGFPVAEMCQ